MDAFYASVEQRDRPELRGRPVVVGGSPNSRGVVCAASYEARAFGVRSAIPCSQARRLCPQAVFIPPDFRKYSEASRLIHGVFREVTDRIEPLALDEAFLDVTENRLGEPLAGKVAKYLKFRVREVTGLTASAGVGPNKLIAKLASGHRKPDGLVIVPPDAVEAFLAPLPIDALWGVGPATAERLRALGLQTVADLRTRRPEELAAHLGRWGLFLHDQAFGRDERPVETSREPRSRGAETTLATDIRDLDALVELMRHHAEDVAESLRRAGRRARTVTVKVRFSDFATITRSRTPEAPVAEAAELLALGEALLRGVLADDARAIRLVGLSAANLVAEDAPRQLRLPLPELQT
jgi:DNA polymerase-4